MNSDIQIVIYPDPEIGSGLGLEGDDLGSTSRLCSTLDYEPTQKSIRIDGASLPFEFDHILNPSQSTLNLWICPKTRPDLT